MTVLPPYRHNFSGQLVPGRTARPIPTRLAQTLPVFGQKRRTDEQSAPPTPPGLLFKKRLRKTFLKVVDRLPKRRLSERPHWSGLHYPGSKAAIVQRLQKVRFYHALDTPAKLKEFLTDPAWTAVDMDLRYDKDAACVVVTHDAATPQSPRFIDWMATFLQQPVQKTGAFKLDIKERQAIDPLITDLKALYERFPALQKRPLILNADIPLGSSHAKAPMQLSDMQKLRNAFPKAVISLGLQSTVKNVDAPMLQDIQAALEAIDGPITVVFHVTTPVHNAVFQQLDQAGAFITLWANRKAKIDGSAKHLQIPPDRFHQVVLDY